MLREQKNREEFVAKFQLKQQPHVLDINDWKQLFNNQLFQIICDQLPVGISICIDTSCREIRHNTVAAGFFRINAWDNLSHSSPNIPPLKLFMNDNEILPEEMPIQKSMWSGQTITDLEVSLLWEDGIKKIIIFNSRPLLDTNGKVIGAIATSEDITERKHREQERDNLMQEIDRERARSQAIIEALPVGLFLVDAQGKLLLVNDVAYDVCGGEVYFASDANDYSPYKCWWTDTGEKLAPEDFPVIRSLKGETFKNAAIDFERLNGTMSSQLISSAPIVTSDGSIDGSVAIAQDITERVREQKALSESEARFRKLFYDSPDPAVIIKLEDGCRIDINSKFEKLLGYSREEIIGSTAADFTFWADSENKKTDYIKKLQEEGSIQNYEFKIRTKSDEILTVLSSSVLIEWEKKPCRLTIMRDITKDKEIEAELARFDRLNLIGEMAASIGHEIRNQ